MDKKHELQQVAREHLPDPIIIIGYMEHQLDLIGQLVVDIAEGVQLSPEATDRLELLKQVVAYASVDFANISHQFQSYKIPKAVELKQHTRNIQGRYLQAQLREGILGE
jgi:hypothetical protein